MSCSTQDLPLFFTVTVELAISDIVGLGTGDISNPGLSTSSVAISLGSFLSPLLGLRVLEHFLLAYHPHTNVTTKSAMSTTNPTTPATTPITHIGTDTSSVCAWCVE